tara:strand:+ start:987 stop:1319 length:333 start_codon:yes stop_codon:yes gene_type:complete
MKDQKTLDDSQSKEEKWNRGKTLFLESVHKPDHQLRSCAHNQHCYNELMEIRDQVVEMVQAIPNPHTPKLEFGKKNNHVEPTITTPNGEISETLMSGTLREHYMTDHREY